MKNQKYFIGLDIGVESVGFAVTDENYNLIKKGKKELWGIRLFESGNTAAERRLARSARRRNERKRKRIRDLRELFDEEISKIDPAFFMRLDESVYHIDDKSDFQYNTLFNDREYKDKDYHSKYPTAFHLRKALINGEIDDIRLLYLGVAHILKNRGHFLFAGQDFSEITKFSTAYNALQIYLSENFEDLAFDIDDIQQIENILTDKSTSMTDKEKSILSMFKSKASNEHKNLIKLILGGKIELSKILTNSNLEEDVLKTKICFKSGFEEVYPNLQQNLDEYIILIDLAKAIYDWSILCDILNGEDYLSYSKIKVYEEHKNDLKNLKKLVKEFAKSSYKDIFKNENIANNYPSYIGMTMKHGKKLVIENKKCNAEDLCKYLESKLGKIETENADYLNVLDKIQKRNLLPKQIVKENGVIPYQVHLAELKKILEINSLKFNFLRQSDGEFTTAEKIEKLFMFRIPYYVGTLNQNAKTHWMVRKTNEKITAWNFDKVVDTGASAEAFIKRMTNKCTYLKNADVIPKNSLLYSKYEVLNELNNIKINGETISPTLKIEIYENVFKTNLRVTKKKIESYIKKNCLGFKTVEITGLESDFKSSLKSYLDFKNIFGGFDEKMAEDIIKWITLFGDDKVILKNKIIENYPLNKEQLKKVSALKYRDWGKFSKEFLTEVYSVNKETGEAVNIITALYETNCNLMQLLSKDFDYLKHLEILNKKDEKRDISLEDVKALYCSPAVKKGIWQTVQIVKEIEKIMKGKPEKLFIEMARDKDGSNEKNRTVSRKNNLLYLYNSLKKSEPELYERLANSSDNDLRIKKVYLYYTQMGRCAYSGKKIPFDDLMNNNIYDIEHIYPRSKTKDDSIHNNLVLVNKIDNSKKSDVYPIPSEYRQNELWSGLLQKGLINKEKYKRLTRIEEFSDKELEGFIQRQLVETRQSTKAIAEIFKEYYEDTNSKVVYVKANHVSDFRQQFDFIKVRDLNDYHHAKDAYLNIVVGNVFDTKFTERFFFAIKSNKYTLNPEKLYNYDVIKGDYFAWKSPAKDGGDAGTIATVRKTMESNRILFTRQAYKASGALFDLTIYKKGDGEFAVKNPTNKNSQTSKLMNLEKYGGFKKIKGSYYCVVEHEIKKKINRTIEYIPIHLASQIVGSEEKLIDYLKNDLKLINPKIILKELKRDSLLNVDGFPMHISGRTGDRLLLKGAVQLTLNKEYEKYIKRISNFVARQKINKEAKISNLDIITKVRNLEFYDLLLNKLAFATYKIRLKSMYDKLLTKRDYFETLGLEIQSLVIYNMLSLFTCNARVSDLSLLKEGGHSGKLSISKNITKLSKFELINQSITGVYENKIDLLKGLEK